MNVYLRSTFKPCEICFQIKLLFYFFLIRFIKWIGTAKPFYFKFSIYQEESFQIIIKKRARPFDKANVINEFSLKGKYRCKIKWYDFRQSILYKYIHLQPIL